MHCACALACVGMRMRWTQFAVRSSHLTCVAAHRIGCLRWTRRQAARIGSIYALARARSNRTAATS